MKRSQLHCSICDRMLLDLLMNIILLLINSDRISDRFQSLLTYKYTDTIMYNGCKGNYTVIF